MSITVSPLPGASPYEPPDSLWRLVEKSTPPHEREEIKRMLGESLVEQSLELHDEVNLLLEIWRDYRDETEDLMTRAVPRLPEPPAARDRLKQEIKFFVESIREKSKENGRDVTQSLSSVNTNIVQYALDERCSSSGYGSRPSTARSSTPMLSTDRCRSSMLSTLSDEVEAINDKLTYLKFDEVVAHLRETLESEVLQLREDADFLQKCLDDEVDFRSHSRDADREPSLAELSVERSKLEKELLKPQSPVPSAVRDSKPQHIKPMPTSINSEPLNKRPVPPSIPKSGSQSKRIPLKASHDINVKDNSHNCHPRIGSAGKSKPTTISPKLRSESSSLTDRPRSSSTSDRVSSAGSVRSEVSVSNINFAEIIPSDRNSKSERHAPSEGKYGRLKMPDTSQHIYIRSSQRSAKKDTGNVHKEDHSANETSDSPQHSVYDRPARPSSASRFRRMVQQCRDET